MKAFFKNIRQIVLSIVCIGILFTYSCKKFLDTKPKDIVLESDFPKNYWDAEFLLRGAYGAMQPLVESKFVLGEVPGDWVQPGKGADSDIVELAYHRVSETNRYTNWRPFYDLINRANYVIKTVPKIPLDSNYFYQAIKDQYIGEARFLRCWAYLHLVQSFGPVPFVWDGQVVDDISKVDTLFKIPPTSENVILDSLEADLKRAYATTAIQIFVPNNFDVGLRESQEQSTLRIKRQGVCGLQAEVYLWRNKYAEASAVCQNFYNIEFNSLGRFVGNNNAAWFGIFTQLPNSVGGGSVFGGEPIFRVNFSFAAREINTLMTLTSNDPAAGGKYMIAPSLNAIKTYNPGYPDTVYSSNLKNELYRGFGSSYAGSAPYYNRLNSDPVIWKFIGLSTVTPAKVNVVANVRAPYQSDYCPHIYRYADLFLLWAEALNRVGDRSNAITRINTIRARAGMPSSSTTGQYGDSISVNSSTEKIENYILRERGVELGFEGKRWYDLMRVARHQGTPDAPNVNVVINAILPRVPVAQKATVSTALANTKNWLLPYNADEKKLNPYLVK